MRVQVFWLSRDSAADEAAHRPLWIGNGEDDSVSQALVASTIALAEDAKLSQKLDSFVGCASEPDSVGRCEAEPMPMRFFESSSAKIARKRAFPSCSCAIAIGDGVENRAMCCCQDRVVPRLTN